MFIYLFENGYFAAHVVAQLRHRSARHGRFAQCMPWRWRSFCARADEEEGARYRRGAALANAVLSHKERRGVRVQERARRAGLAPGRCARSYLSFVSAYPMPVAAPAPAAPPVPCARPCGQWQFSRRWGRCVTGGGAVVR